MASLHIFDPVTDEEILTTTSLLKELHGDAKLFFSQVDRLDPPKKDALIYLDIERYGGGKLPYIPRRTYAYYYVNNKMPLYKAIVNVSEKHIISSKITSEGTIGPLQPDGMLAIEEAVLEHPIVKAEIAKLQLDKLSYNHPNLGKMKYKVVCEPWMYGTDSPKEKIPLIQTYMYLSLDHPDSNHYSIPLRFSPVFEYLSHKFVRMDYLPSGADEKYIRETLPLRKIHSIVEYHPDLLEDYKPRENLKPLIISQPEGPSFNVDGNKITWQGWEFRVSTNVREGFALYDVYFKGRSLFYRIALNEMTVPYGDPRPPFHRKQAFDLGDCGFGNTANSLALGCHCLGVIKYLDTRRADISGNPILIPSTICMHEQDYGLLFLHKNYRTDKSVVTRRREFVIQTIATVANYEYIINLVFDQAGAITVQVRATGILSTMPNDDHNVTNFGTIVGPGVTAAFHQHLLSFRFDTRIDGDKNTVVYDDYVPMEENEMNAYDVGFMQKRNVVEKSGFVDQSPFTNRAYKVINENSINPVTMKPVGYKFEMPAKQMILASPNSYNVKRARYATKQFWVTKYHEDELYAAGEFTNQSQTDTGLSVWADGTDAVRNTDTVVWATLALTHPPVTEQFPVMTSDFLQFLVTPASFFDKNPALDVPLATNNFNKSVYYEESQKSTGSGSCCRSNL